MPYPTRSGGCHDLIQTTVVSGWCLGHAALPKTKIRYFPTIQHVVVERRHRYATQRVSYTNTSSAARIRPVLVHIIVDMSLA